MTTKRKSPNHAAKARQAKSRVVKKAAKEKATKVKSAVKRVPNPYRAAITAAMESKKVSTFTFGTPEELKDAAYAAWGARRLMKLSADVGVSMTEGKLVIGPYAMFVKEKKTAKAKAKSKSPKRVAAKDMTEDTPKLVRLSDGSVTVGPVKKARSEKSPKATRRVA